MNVTRIIQEWTVLNSKSTLIGAVIFSYLNCTQHNVNRNKININYILYTWLKILI